MLKHNLRLLKRLFKIPHAHAGENLPRCRRRPVLLSGKTIAVLGYGSQGRAQAQNLRDSGCRVIVAELPGMPGHARAESDGFEPVSAARAAAEGDLVLAAAARRTATEVFRDEIRPNLSPGKVLVAAHGFDAPLRADRAARWRRVRLGAPNGPGSLVRSEYLLGRGVPCLVAVAGQGQPPAATDCPAPLARLGLAYAKAIGCTRWGDPEHAGGRNRLRSVRRTGGALRRARALMKAAFETLVDAGYQAEVAYLVCVQELKQIVDLVYQRGLCGMRQMISARPSTAIIPAARGSSRPTTKAEMGRILEEVRDGRFAREWFAEAQSGGPAFEALRQQQRIRSNQAGRNVRTLMPWLEDATEPPASRRGVAKCRH